MSFRLINLVFALLFLAGCFAGPLAVKGQDKPQAIKIHEFRFINASLAITNLEALGWGLRNYPLTRGFIIVYRPICALPGASNRFGLYGKAYLQVSLKIDASRLVVIDGGAALVDSITFELWVVPPGATPQIRKDVVYSNDLTSYPATIKYDEHYWHTKDESEDYSYDYSGLESRLDGFAKVLQQQSDLRGYIVGYSHPRDSSAQILKLLREEKSYLVKTYGLAALRIKIVNGGYRKYRLFELWLVPPDDAAPQPLSLPLKRKR